MPANTKFELKLGVATREAFGRALVEVAKENPNVVCCDADLSKSTNTNYFAKEFPERFFECGIAEANMVAIGAGLAMGGKIPFVSSFSCFLLNKSFEQLRTTVAYPQVNLKAVGTHSGISIGEDGPSQMSVEDLALACSLPGFWVYSPADEVSMKAIVKIAAGQKDPCFIRAGRVKAPIIYQPDQKFEAGKAIKLIPGNDLTIFATGLMVAEAIRAAEILEAEGISAQVYDIHTIKPLDEEAIARAAAETGALVVTEEHLVDAGLGVRVAQVVAKTNPCPIEFHGLTGYAESGSPEAVMAHYGLTADKVAAAARKAFARKRA